MATASKRRAVSISISTVESPDDLGDERQFLNLDFAEGLSSKLTDALASSFGYEVENVVQPKANEIDGSFAKLMTDASECRIAHVIGHGVASGNDLHIVGSDGQHSDPINQWTREPSAVILNRDAFAKTPTLFIVDSCSAGTAVLEQLFHVAADGVPHRWVVAASSPGTAAFDGRLTRAARKVIRRINDHKLDISPTHSHVSYMKYVNELRAQLGKLDGNGPKQHLRVTPVELDDEDGAFPFFPNPAYRPDAPKAPRPELTSFLESVELDWTHWLSRASGGVDHKSGYPGAFAGRRPELALLTKFIHGDSERNALIVTGAPGSGKSALLSLLVCNAHPELSERTRVLWADHVDDLPGLAGSIAAVHARQLTVHGVVEAIQRQLKLIPVSGPEELVSQIEALDEQPLIVIDAVDEASVARDASVVGVDLVAGLLRPLMEAVRPDGRSAVRIILGTRRWVAAIPLVDEMGDRAEVIDLDAVPLDRLEAELRRYGELRLASWGRKDDRAAVAQALASRLIAHGRTADTNGHFLAASLFLAGLLAEPDINTEEAIARALAAPREVGELLMSELERLPDSDTLLHILKAVALAKGNGAPVGVLLSFSCAIHKDFAATESDYLDLLAGPLSFYLRTSPDIDGSVLYRLFHQGLVDLLRIGAVLDEAAFRSTLLAEGADWQFARPYALRHAIEHARDIDAAEGRVALSLVSSLWCDAGFVLRCDPRIARAYPPPPESPGYGPWEVYAASTFPAEAPELERAQALAVLSVRMGRNEQALRLRAYASRTSFWPLWGTKRVIARKRIDERYPATSLPLGDFDGYGSVTCRAYNREGPARIEGRIWGAVFAYDSLTARKGYIGSHGASVSSVAVSPNGAWIASVSVNRGLAVWESTGPSLALTARLAEVPRVVVISDDGRVVVGCDAGGVRKLASNLQAPEHNLDLPEHGRVSALLQFQAGHYLIAFQSGALVEWDPVTAEAKEVARAKVAITALAFTRDEGILICGSSDGTVHRRHRSTWSLLGDEEVASEYLAVVAVRMLPDGYTFEAFDENGASTSWDVFSGVRVGLGSVPVADPKLTIASVDSKGVIVSASARSIWTMDASEGKRVTVDWLAEHPRTHFVISQGVESDLADFVPRELIPWSRRRKHRFAVRGMSGTDHGVVVGATDGSISGWELLDDPKEGSAWAPLWKRQFELQALRITGSQDLIVVMFVDGSMVAMHSLDGALIARAERDGTRQVVASSPDFVLVGHSDGRLTSWDPRSDFWLGLGQIERKKLTAIALAGDILMVGDQEGAVLAYRTESLRIPLWSTRMSSSVEGIYPRNAEGAGVAVVTFDGTVGSRNLLDGTRGADDFVSETPCSSSSYDGKRDLLSLISGSEILTLSGARSGAGDA